MIDTEALEDTTADLAAVAEAFPGLAPMIQEQMNHAVAPVSELMAFLDGEMSRDEYLARSARREQENLTKREATYGEPDEQGLWHVSCQECHRDFSMDELPSMYPECDDIGEECL